MRSLRVVFAKNGGFPGARVPAARLDSHLYSASIDECYAALLGFDGNWLLSANTVFEMELPDPITGACPSGDVRSIMCSIIARA